MIMKIRLAKGQSMYLDQAPNFRYPFCSLAQDRQYNNDVHWPYCQKAFHSNYKHLI